MIVGDCSIFSLVFLWNDVNYDVRGYFYREREKERGGGRIEIFDVISLAEDLILVLYGI